jgi:hypothetical protein
MKNRQLRRLIGERVVVHTRDARSLRGVVVAVHGDWLVLGDPEYLEEARATGMPGEVWVERANRSWIHRVGGAS